MLNKKNIKCIGLIVNSHNIVAIEVSNKKNGPEVTNYSKIALEQNVVESNCIIAEPDKFKEAVKKLLKNGLKGAIKTKEIFVALPEENTFSHQIIVPKEHLNDVDYIKEKAKDYIPIELEEAVFDYRAINEDENKKVTLKFIATQNIIVESLIKALKEIELEVIKVDVDIDCLIKTFDSRLNHNEGDVLLINTDESRDLISITKKGGENYRIISKKSEGEVLEKFTSKIKNLIKASSADGPLEIKTVYLTGPLSRLAGLKEMIAKIFPGINIKTGIEFAEIPNEVENDLLIGIGICINQMADEGGKDFNLLPEARKEELSIAPLIPKISRYLIIAMILLVIPLIQIGIQTTRNYIDYEVRSQEVIILIEQSLNPYLTSIAKLKIERNQVRQQILAVLGDSIPVSVIMKSLDEYNKDGIDFINLSYRSDLEADRSEANLTAEAKNREVTEAFVENIKKSNLYIEVDSPLSNLMGKSKRLIKVDLLVDKNTVIDRFNTEKTDKDE